MVRRVSFYIWLLEQRKRNDPIGYLADDVFNYWRGDWPENCTMQNYKDILGSISIRDTHMKELGGHSVSKAILEKAWWEYVDILPRDLSDRIVMREIVEVIKRASIGVEKLDDPKYVVDGEYALILQKLIQKLDDICKPLTEPNE